MRRARSLSLLQLRLKVWLRLLWRDDRLRWDPAEYGGLTETFFLGQDITNTEVTEIWLPDIQPYNALEGFVHTLEPALASVNYQGEVYWSRPGSLYAMCKFSGVPSQGFNPRSNSAPLDCSSRRRSRVEEPRLDKAGRSACTASPMRSL